MFNFASAAMNPQSSAKAGIKHGLQAVFNDGFERAYPFASGSQYPAETAPDPEITVQWGLPSIELPLKEADALALISSARFAQRSGWEIPAEKLLFANPEWQNWIQNVAGPASLRCIGVPENALHNEYVLQSLLIHEGSQAVRWMIETGANKLGELIVILPSSFTGGDLAFAHLGEVGRIPLNDHQQKLSVVSAYAGVAEIIAPVTAGFRISLVYHILHGDQYTLPNLDSPKQKLLRLLYPWTLQATRSWNYPRLIGCLLNNKYTHSTMFDSSSLNGTTDELLFKMLCTVAREMGFALYFGQIELVVQSEASDTTASFWDYDIETVNITETFDVDGVPVEILGLCESMHANDLVIREGVILQAAISVVYSAEVSRWTFEFISGVFLLIVCDTEDPYIFDHTTLLLWPLNSVGFRVKETDSTYDYAREVLENSESTTPNRRERHIFETLSGWCSRAYAEDKSRTDLAARVLQRCSERWSDADMFLRAMVACGADKSITVMGVEGFAVAYSTWGWGVLRKLCTAALTNDKSKALRWDLTKRLSEMAVDYNDVELQTWCRIHHCTLLNSLQNTQPEDTEWLVELVLLSGGEFLKKFLYPQLAVQWLPIQDFWIPFLKQLHENRARIPCMNDPKAVYDVIAQGLQKMVATLRPFTTRVIDGVQVADVDMILEILRCGLEMDHGMHVCAIVADKMRDAAAVGDYDKSCPPWQYYDALAKLLFVQDQDDDYGSESRQSYWLKRFFQDAAIFLLSPWGTAEEHPFDLRIVEVISRAGGLSFLNTLFKHQPHLFQRHDPESLRELAKDIMARFKPTDASEYKAVKDFILDAGMDAIDVEQVSCDKVIESIQFCLEIGASAATLERFLLRVVDAVPVGVPLDVHVSNTLIPILMGP
ncbi:hypothetical protein C8F01DRAFT_1279437 [Mycena amicta]|nr:hypothetical protein C8F01DRAFT_1279437 [Mycena amicta]